MRLLDAAPRDAYLLPHIPGVANAMRFEEVTDDTVAIIGPNMAPEGRVLVPAAAGSHRKLLCASGCSMQTAATGRAYGAGIAQYGAGEQDVRVLLLGLRGLDNNSSTVKAELASLLVLSIKWASKLRALHDKGFSMDFVIGDRRAYDLVVRLMGHGAAAAATAGDTDHATTTLSTAVVLVLELYEQAEVGVTLRWQPRTGLALNPHAHANQLAKQLAGDTTKGCNVSLELRADGLLDLKGLTVDGMQGRLRDMFTPKSFVTRNADIPPN